MHRSVKEAEVLNTSFTKDIEHLELMGNNFSS